MAVRKRMELNFYADRERPRPNYDKLNENYWEYQICENRHKKCRILLSEIAEANENYPRTEPATLSLESTDSLSTDEIEVKLMSLGVNTTAKERKTQKRLREQIMDN